MRFFLIFCHNQKLNYSSKSVNIKLLWHTQWLPILLLHNVHNENIHSYCRLTIICVVQNWIRTLYKIWSIKHISVHWTNFQTTEKSWNETYLNYYFQSCRFLRINPHTNDECRFTTQQAVVFSTKEGENRC